VAGSPWQELVAGDRSAVGYNADGGGGGGSDGSDASGGGGGGYLEHQVVWHTLHSYPLFQFPHACQCCTRDTTQTDRRLYPAIDDQPNNHAHTLKITRQGRSFLFRSNDLFARRENFCLREGLIDLLHTEAMTFLSCG